MQKGISKQVIFKESERMLKAHGLEGFSVRSLSMNLDIKPASLYNHIEGIDEIYGHLAKKASEMMIKKLNKAIEGRTPDEAFIESAKAYRKFAETNREYYLMLIKMRSSKNEITGRLGYESFKPIIDVIRSYGLPQQETLHFVRSFRAFLHGFVEITHNGFMQRGPATKDETFDTAVRSFLEILKGGKVQ